MTDHEFVFLPLFFNVVTSIGLFIIIAAHIHDLLDNISLLQNINPCRPLLYHV